MKTAFFDYFNRGLREGLTPTEAYRWAITEDLYDAEDHPLGPGQATADGMCWHPSYAIRAFGRFKLRGLCEICGVLINCRFPHKSSTRIYKRPPVKIPTRSEIARAIATNTLRVYS